MGPLPAPSEAVRRTATRAGDVARRRLHKLRSVLPTGLSLPESAWLPRHRAILALLWLHVAGVLVFGLATGYGLAHALLEIVPIAAAAAVATPRSTARGVRMAAASFGLLSSSAVLVHLSGGVIELHFHFFVMVAIVALYQSWFPFLLAVAYVVVHHGVIGVLDPASVYNHPDALAHPWRWAGIHGLFIAGESVACLAAWRFNETAQRATQSSLSLLHATLESTADGLLVVDLSGRIVSHNRKFVELWQIPDEIVASGDDERALGYVVGQLVDPDAFLRKVTELYADPVARSYDLLMFKDGRVVERYSQPQEVDGRCVGRVWSFRDVTERHQAERTLQQALEREQEASRRLRALDEMKSTFLAAVSHELRTPLTAILGFSLTLQQRGDAFSPGARNELLDRLAGGARKLDALLSDLLDVDRLARGVLQPQLESTDLATLVRATVDTMPTGGRVLELELEPVRVPADAAKVKRIVEALIGNAVKYTPDSSCIRVRLDRTERGAVISVEDEGPGVPDDLKGAIFEPFRRGATISAHAPGTGIGLALVAQYASIHGGRAWVEDRAGGGAAFRVSLSSAAPGTALETVPEVARRRELAVRQGSGTAG